MSAASFGHGYPRFRRRTGIAAVEKVLVLSGIVGVMTFSTLVLGKFSDYSGTLKSALALEPIPDRFPSSASVDSARPFLLTTQVKTLEDHSTKGWLIAGLSLSFVMIVTAVVLTREKRRKKTPAPNPIREIAEIKKKLEPKIAPGNVFTKRQQTMAILLNRLGGEAFDEMRIGHLVSPKVTTVLPSTSIEEVQKMFMTQHFRHLFVCDLEGNLHGIISARDMQRSQSGTAKDIMSTDIVVANSEQLISPTITLMMDRRISCLPVVDQDRLVGIVTTTDLLIALQCTLQILQSLGNPNAESTSKFGRRRSSEADCNTPSNFDFSV